MSLQASLLSEKTAAEEAHNACTDAEARNAEIVKKLEDSERKVDQLQESVQRSVLKIKFVEYKLVVLCIKMLTHTHTHKRGREGSLSSQS